MQGQTVPCRLTDFKAVRLCYVPPSLIWGAAGGLFSSPGTLQGTDSPTVKNKNIKKTACTVFKMYLLWETFILVVHSTFTEADYYAL